MHPRLLRPLPCQDHLQGRPVLASHSRAMPLQLLRQSPRDCLPRQEAARHKAIASLQWLQYLLRRSSSMKASRSRPSGLLKQLQLDFLHKSRRPLLQTRTAPCTATAQQQHQMVTAALTAHLVCRQLQRQPLLTIQWLQLAQWLPGWQGRWASRGHHILRVQRQLPQARAGSQQRRIP